MKTDLFQSCGHCWIFQICWHIECSIFTASCFRIWNNSPGILSPPLALFIVMLPKALLTSLSRMAGFRWVITLSWLSVSWISFFVQFFYVSCHLFLIASASVRSIWNLSFIVLIFAWNVPLLSLIFLKRSLVFPILYFPLFLFIDLWWSLSYFSLLFFGTQDSVEYMSRNRISGSYDSYDNWGTCQIGFQSCLYFVCNPSNNAWCFQFLHVLTNTCHHLFLDFRHSVKVWSVMSL